MRNLVCGWQKLGIRVLRGHIFQLEKERDETIQREIWGYFRPFREKFEDSWDILLMVDCHCPGSVWQGLRGHGDGFRFRDREQEGKQLLGEGDLGGTWGRMESDAWWDCWLPECGNFKAAEFDLERTLIHLRLSRNHLTILDYYSHPSPLHLW